MTTLNNTSTPTAEERKAMHALYRQGGKERLMAPHIVYEEATCPHAGCEQRLQAIDFRLEAHGRSVHDPLVRAWWDDTGFAGRCPGCQGWIHFTIRGKRAITDEEAAQLPQLPDQWHASATIL
ncbi:MAG: hypothetical protein U0797_23865 [Gemmataceae bacterium]